MSRKRRKKQYVDAVGYTIDPKGAKEIDDAIYIIEHSFGYELVVGIADVSNMLPIGSYDDDIAYQRVCTRYDKNPYLPMLPPELSEERASLTPHQIHDASIYRIYLNTDFDVTGVKMEQGTFRSKGKYSYEQVSKALNNPSHAEFDRWQFYYWFVQQLSIKRTSDVVQTYHNDAPSMTIPGHSTGVRRAHMIVEECMLLVNSTIPTHLESKGVPLLFRNHVPREYGGIVGETMFALYEQHKGWMSSGEISFFERYFASSESRAHHDARSVGHYALGFSNYAQLTSPLRSYSNLINSRQKSAYLRRQHLPYSEPALREKGQHIDEVYQKMRFWELRHEIQAATAA